MKHGCRSLITSRLSAGLVFVLLSGVSLFYIARPVVAAEPFTYENLVSLVQSHSITSIETLLPLLSEELRANYTLLYRSRSLQGASPLVPRTVLFGNDASLTCAFSGSPEMDGGSELECIQFRIQERAFDFRQIEFPSRTNGLTTAQFSERGRTADGKVSCLGCHGGADPRPNWDAYPKWPGVYGSADDSLTPEEQKNYAAFTASRAAHPRYRHLIQGSETLAPYGGRGILRDRPNLRFTEATTRMNALRAARLIGNYLPKDLAYGFAVTSLGCSFSAAQTARLNASGKHWREDISLPRLYERLGMRSGPLTTRIFDDPAGKSPPPQNDFEHLAGYGSFTKASAVAVLEGAAEGDAVLTEALAGLQSLPRYAEDEGKFFRGLDSTFVPDPYFFAAVYSSNLKRLCPRVTERFVTEFSSGVTTTRAIRLLRPSLY